MESSNTYGSLKNLIVTNNIIGIWEITTTSVTYNKDSVLSTIANIINAKNIKYVTIIGVSGLINI